MAGRGSCVRCGVDLPPVDPDGNIVCAGCGMFHHPGADPAPFGTASGSGAIPPPPPRSSGPFGAGAQPVRDDPAPPPPQDTLAPAGPRRSVKTRRRMGCSVLALIVGFLVALPFVATVLITRTVSTSGPEGAAALSPTWGDLLVLDDSSTPEVVALANQLGSGARVVALAELDGELAWTASVVPPDTYSAQFAVGTDPSGPVLVSLGAEVIALDRGSGDVLWRTDVTDIVDARCDDCFEVIGDRLVVVSRDAQVAAFAVASGEPTWSRRLESAQGRVRRVDDSLLVLDATPPPEAQARIEVVDPTDGGVVDTFTPGCPEAEGSPAVDFQLDATIERIAGTDDVVLAFGFGRGCFQRWTVSTPELRWSTRRDDAGSLIRPLAATGPNDMVLSTTSALWRIGLAEGTVEPVVLPTDTRPGPAAIAGTTLVVTAETSRGTARAQLVGIDLRSGAQLWVQPLPLGTEAFDLETTRSIDSLSGNQSRVVAVPDDDGGLRLVAVGPGRRVSVETVDLASGDRRLVGTDTARVRFESTSTSVRIEEIAADRVIFSADSVVQVVDLGTGRLTSSWGG